MFNLNFIIFSKKHVVATSSSEQTGANYRLTSATQTVRTHPSPGGILPTIINDMVVSCCQSCRSHGPSVLDFNVDGDGGKSEKSSDAVLREAISERTELNFPIPGYMEQERFGAGHGYWPVVQTPGVAHIVNTGDGYSPSNALNNTLVSCWAALLLVFVMSLLSGFLMWILVIFAVVHINKTLI